MKKNLSVKFQIGADQMEVNVTYDTAEPHNYTVTSAYHNGTDVTAFYLLCEAQNEAIFYPQVVEGIAAEECGKRIEKRATLNDNFKELGEIFKPYLGNETPVASWSGITHILPRGFPEHIGTL